MRYVGMNVLNDAGPRVAAPSTMQADIRAINPVPVLHCGNGDPDLLPVSWIKIVHAPWRRPCWRWDLAGWSIREQRKPPREFADKWVEVAHRLLSDPSSADDPVYQALRLFRNEGPALRDMVEAYVLADSPPSLVARRCDIDPTVVDVYEPLFFDVRPRLQARDWIALNAIGHYGLTPFKKQEIGRLWKAVGYHGGLHALDALVAVSLADGLVAGHGEVPMPPVALDERTRRSVLLFIMAKMLPLSTQFKHLALFHEQALRIEAVSSTQRGSVAEKVGTSTEQIFVELLCDRACEVVPLRAAV
jgi:hypothetical protein